MPFTQKSRLGLGTLLGAIAGGPNYLGSFFSFYSLSFYVFPFLFLSPSPPSFLFFSPFSFFPFFFTGKRGKNYHSFPSGSNLYQGEQPHDTLGQEVMGTGDRHGRLHPRSVCRSETLKLSTSSRLIDCHGLQSITILPEPSVRKWCKVTPSVQRSACRCSLDFNRAL